MTPTIDRLKKINSKYGILLCLLTHDVGAIKKNQAKEVLLINDAQMQKVCEDLIYRKLISITIADNGESYCVANYEDNVIDTVCMKCSKHFIKKYGNIDICICDSARCKYKDVQTRQNVAIATRTATKRMAVTGVKAHKDKDKPVESWGVAEFTKYFRIKFKKTFIGISIPIPHAKIQDGVKELLTLTKRMVGNREYGLYCKRHIDEIYRTFKTSDHFSMARFLKIDLINSNINRYDRASNVKKASANLCTLYKTLCSYFNDGKCDLKVSGIGCNEKIRKYISEKYNI